MMSVRISHANHGKCPHYYGECGGGAKRGFAAAGQQQKFSPKATPQASKNWSLYIGRYLTKLIIVTL